MAIILTGKHRKMLERLKSRPATIEWKEVESLLLHVGYTVREGASSHVMFVHPTLPFFHTSRPHPRKTIIHWQIKDVLEHLNKIGL